MKALKEVNEKTLFILVIDFGMVGISNLLVT